MPSNESAITTGIGLAALTLTLQLISGLVRRGLLSIDDAKEIADTALLDLERHVGNISALAPARSLLESLLQDLHAPQNQRR